MEVTFQQHPTVVIGSNAFIHVPIIIQYEDTPLLEVGDFVEAGFSVKFPVFHRDGTKIAVVKGSRIFPTEEGKAARLTSRYEPNMTVFELEGKPILELRRTEAAALKTWAGLYAPEGVLIKAQDESFSGLLRGGDWLALPNGMVLKDSAFQGCRIGIHYTRSGIGFGVGGGMSHIGELGPAERPTPTRE
jgi:hypothetical protein